MGNPEVFTNNYMFLVTLVSLGLLLVSCFYAGSVKKFFGTAWLLFIGLTLEFCAEGVAVKAAEAYAAGNEVTFYIFMELLLLLVGMIFMALAASNLLLRNFSPMPVVLTISLLGLVAIGAFVFIIPDGAMVNNMRLIFPLAGFVYVAIGFWSKLSEPNNGGYMLAAALNSVIALLWAVKLFDFHFGFILIPSLYYVLMSMAFIIIRSDFVVRKLKETEKQVEAYNQRVEDIIKSSPFPIIISQLGDDKIILANNNAVKLFGINPGELERYHLKDFFADTDNRRLLNERLEQEREVHDFEVLVKTPISETPFWLLASANIIDYNYNLALYTAFQDITSRKNREALLKNQATRDPLTSLYNRRYFEDEVSRLILKAKGDNVPYSVLMLDADLFKKVNDTYGHKVGDKVLIELGNTAERALRDKDIVARYGGEEFVIFLPAIAAEQAERVADRLRESISQAVVYSDEGQPVKFTVSVGVSSSDISDNIDTLIKTADEALYRAKQNGRNRVEVFTRKDLQEFEQQGLNDRRDESQNHHPVFDKENNAEISLLDGIETSRISDEQTFIEPPRPTGEKGE